MNNQNIVARTIHVRVPLLIVALLMLVRSVGAFNFSTTAFAEPQKTRNANVIVQFGDHDVAIRPITFGKKSITGLDALQRTGFKVVTLDT